MRRKLFFWLSVSNTYEERVWEGMALNLFDVYKYPIRLIPLYSFAIVNYFYSMRGYVDMEI